MIDITSELGVSSPQPRITGTLVAIDTGRNHPFLLRGLDGETTWVRTITAYRSSPWYRK